LAAVVVVVVVVVAGRADVSRAARSSRPGGLLKPLRGACWT
jgi:hypothetical protein